MPRPDWRDPKLEQFWRTMVAKWIKSQLNIRDFCRKHRLQEPSFYHWRREIAARDGQPIATQSQPTTTRRSSEWWRLCIFLTHTAVRIVLAQREATTDNGICERLPFTQCGLVSGSHGRNPFCV